MRSNSRCKFGFTLVEIMVVLAAITLLFAILLPTINYMKKISKSAQVTSDFAAITRALEGFKTDFGYYPPKPNPTRTIPADPSFFNSYMWYFLVKCDYDMSGDANAYESEKLKQGAVYLEFPDERFDSSHRLTDPWGTPYGLLLPRKASGWDDALDGRSYPTPFIIWSNGPNLTTKSSEPGMDGIDDEASWFAR